MKRWCRDRKARAVCLLVFPLLLCGCGFMQKSPGFGSKEAWGGEAREYFGNGLAEHSKGDYDGAIADYDKAIQLKPDYADAYMG